ncbi:MAG TPA: hypothetical protein VGB14_04120 [Acidimicrobiales bacterium]|jgi:hypothetical protein
MPETAAATIERWFVDHVPSDWLAAPATVTVDNDEILVLLPLPEPTAVDGDGDPDARRAARISAFREETRERRIDIATQAEHLFQRKVSWGAVIGDTRRVFTSLAVPVMTRLRMTERAVLDLLIDAGVARSRSEALAWCVRLVEKHERAWIDDLRAALEHVKKARASGPVSI